AVEKFETRKNIMGYRLPNNDDKLINVIGEGKLVNIAAGDGHPAEIMDLSFAVQILGALYILRNHEKLPKGLVDVSDEIDHIVARRRLEAWGIEIDKLTEEQEAYLSSWQ
ncbi:MAG: adenosylhomocysteinase, partial [Bacillota bacterium]|nr:adenosylhomocysteinase [Bacillota bacterium]